MLAKGALATRHFLHCPFLKRTDGTRMIATKDSFEPHSSEQLPNSRKVYIESMLHKDVRVPMREIALAPTKSFNGQMEVNEPVRVYDCSGPWGDPTFAGTVEK